MHLDKISAFQSFRALKPLFIGGQWRSGTTLLQRLLDGHPNLLVYPLEENIVYSFLAGTEINKREMNEGFSERNAKRIFFALTNSPKLRLAIEKQIDLRGKSIEIDSIYIGPDNVIQTGLNQTEFQTCFIETLSSLPSSWTIYDVLMVWMFSYFSACGILDFSSYSGWATKSPADLGRCLEPYLEKFQDCRIVHLVRDPRAFWVSAKSILSKWRGPEENWFHSFFLEIKGLFVELKERKALFKLQSKVAKEHGSRFIFIRYEDLALQPEATMEKISKFFGISVHQILTRPTLNGELWHSNSSFDVKSTARGEIYLDSINRWKESIFRYEKWLVEGAVSDELLAFGYAQKVHFRRLKSFLWFFLSMTASSFSIYRKARRNLLCKLIYFLPRITYLVAEPIFFIFGKRLFKKNKPKHILVIRLDFIGDMVLTSSFLRELRKNHPEGVISLVVNSEAYPLVEHCPYVDHVYPVPFPGSKMIRRNITALFRLFRTHLWNQTIDLAFFFGSGWHFYYAAFTAYLSGAKTRIGTSGKEDLENLYANTHLDCLFSPITTGDILMHESDRNLELIRRLGGKIENHKTEVWLANLDFKDAKEILLSHGVRLDEPIVILAPGARTPKKMLSVSKFKKIANSVINRRQGQVVVVGQRGEEPLGFELTEGSSAVNLIGKTTLRQLAALVSFCSLYIGNDSAAAHLAAAVEIPAIVIYCHPKTGALNHLNSPAKFRPLNYDSVIIQPEFSKLPCRDACEADHAHCIEEVNLDEIEKYISLFLTSNVESAL